MLTPAQLATLKTELGTDPRAYGYAQDLPPNPANWNGPAATLNLVRDGTNGGPAISRRRQNITAKEIRNAVDSRDLKAAPTALEGAMLAALIHPELNAQHQLFNDDGTETMDKKNLDRLVGTSQGSQGRVNALGARNGSRAEELFNVTGIVLTDVDIEAAWKS